MTGDKTPAPKHTKIDPFAEIEPKSKGEEMLNALTGGKGCSAIGKILQDIPVEERGHLLTQASSAYSKFYTWQGKDGQLPIVEVSTDRPLPFTGKFGHPETMKWTDTPMKVNTVKREDPKTGNESIIYRQSYDPKTRKVDDTFCKDQ